MTSGWQVPPPPGDDDEVREPVWLSAADRAVLERLVDRAIRRATASAGVLDGLQATRTELRVAVARDTIWSRHNDIVRRALGYPPDVVPVRLGDRERRAVVALPDLPAGMRSAFGVDEVPG